MKAIVNPVIVFGLKCNEMFDNFLSLHSNNAHHVIYFQVNALQCDVCC